MLPLGAEFRHSAAMLIPPFLDCGQRAPLFAGDQPRRRPACRRRPEAGGIADLGLTEVATRCMPEAFGAAERIA